MEASELVHVIRHFLTNVVDAYTTTSDGSKLFAEDSVELLGNLASLFEIFKDEDHVIGLIKELLDLGEIPPDNGQLVLNLLLSPFKLRLPAIKNLDASLNVSDGLSGLNGLLENGPDVNLEPDLLADLIRDGL